MTFISRSSSVARLSPEFTHRNSRLAALGFSPQRDCGSNTVNFDLTEPKQLATNSGSTQKTLTAEVLVLTLLLTYFFHQESLYWLQHLFKSEIPHQTFWCEKYKVIMELKMKWQEDQQFN